MTAFEITFHFAVILMSIIIFALKVTTTNHSLEMFYKTLSKLVPLFAMVYSAIQLLKEFGAV